MKLSDLHTGQKAIIRKVNGRTRFRNRITEMGFIKGKLVSVVKNAPLNDPIEYELMGYQVLLRRAEADLIEVEGVDDAQVVEKKFHGVIIDEALKQKAREQAHTIEVALIGNPNSGKTSLFNLASNSREHTGNYSGVTVDMKTAEFNYKGYIIRITDLPGTYSLSNFSAEELYVRNYLFENYPDVVVNVVDSNNLERNLYLTLQLIDMDLELVVALNIYDELQRDGAKLDYKALGAMLGTPFVPTVGTKGKGVKELLDRIVAVYTKHDKTARHIHVNYGNEVEGGLCKLQDLIWKNQPITHAYSSRFLALKLIEKDELIHTFLKKNATNYNEIAQTVADVIKSLETAYREASETIITDARYGFISGALKETYTEGGSQRKKRTNVIDSLLTHKTFGYPVFLLFIFLMFFATFKLGQYPVNWFEKLIMLVSQLAGSLIPAGIMHDLVVDGIIGGVGGVIVFLPNIILLFLFIAFMEDTGYMARAVFITDKLMHKIGLHGRSFIPLIMGFGCNVPAIMATRSIENRANRLVTMLIIPFMSCSARLPVYVLIISALFPQYPGFMLFTVYALGVFLAIATALLLNKKITQTDNFPFVMELPPYRMPTLRTILRHMWFKASMYLKKMGGVILIASLIIWALGYFPRTVTYSTDFDSAEALIVENYEARLNEVEVENRVQMAQLTSEKDSLLQQLRLNKESERHQQSFIGLLGKTIEPIMRPLGFDWKMSVSVITGFPAKEIIVSSMGVLYQATDESSSLITRLREQTFTSGPQIGQKVFNTASALSFMFFVLIYSPCLASIAALKNESGSWKWAVFSIIYTCVLAWVVSFITYQVAALIVL